MSENFRLIKAENLSYNKSELTFIKNENRPLLNTCCTPDTVLAQFVSKVSETKRGDPLVADCTKIEYIVKS